MKEKSEGVLKREQNLKPFPKGHKPPPGSGRPKGVKNFKNTAKYWLELEMQGKNPVTQEDVTMSVMDEVVLALIRQARKGNVQAIKELLDRMEGKVMDKVDHTSGGEKITTRSWTIQE